MQPVIVISSRVPGMIYLNGRFAGECAEGMPLIMPVSPRGPLYIEHRPLARGYAGQAHRVTFAGGALMPESVPEGTFAVRWPGNVAELELSAAPLARAESAFANIDGLPVAILRGEQTQLRVAGREIALPDGAELPEERAALGENACFLGRAGASRYLACFSAGDFSPMGAVVADDIEIEEGTRVRALTRLHDAVGHARIEIWEAQGDALVQADAEHAWAGGTPVWPRSAEDAARAALEAAILGLSDEAEGYLAPHLRGQSLVQALAEGFDACVPLRYAIPDARSAVGLMCRETARCAAVTPVYYEAVPMGGQQGAWAIASMVRGEDAGEER